MDKMVIHELLYMRKQGKSTKLLQWHTTTSVYLSCSSKNWCSVLAHTFRNWICNHISVSLVSPWLRLALRFLVQRPDDASEFEGGVFEYRKHGSLVRPYVFLMTSISTVTL
jgi:hypothetical protein